MTSQALGLTWDFIRERAVKILGERPVQAIEEGFEIFQIIKTDGIAGAWEHLKEQFSDLKETIMDSMMGMIISEIMEAGIQSILALLTPAGAFVKAAMMIVDVAKFFLQQGSQIFELVNAFTASISAIAAGNVSKIAQSIENALAISVPVLIGFFSSLLGIGDLLGKVQTIFKKITGRITNTIDGFIEKAGAWFKDKKARRRERREQRRAERDEQNEENNPQDKAKVDKGIRLGTAIVNNENLTEEQIQVELRQLEQREGLKELDADVVNKTEQWHTFMLEAKEGSERKTKQIRRKPTKATNEDEVSEADRQLHQRIADEVKRKLQAKGESTEGVENFEAFYEMLKGEALKLQQEYQPQLRNGIKIVVDLVNQVQKDKQDGDVDVKITIAPNSVEKKITIKSASKTTNEELKELDSALRRKYSGQNFISITDYRDAVNSLLKTPLKDRSVRSIVKQLMEMKDQGIFDSPFETLYSFSPSYTEENYYQDGYLFLTKTDLINDAFHASEGHRQIIEHAKFLGVNKVLEEARIKKKAEKILNDVFFKGTKYTLYHNGGGKGPNSFYAFKESYLSDLSDKNYKENPENLALAYNKIKYLGLKLAPLKAGKNKKLTSREVVKYRRDIRKIILKQHENSSMTEFNKSNS